MELDRREFLKWAGAGAAGLTLVPAWKLFGEAALPQESPLTAKRWAMIIDLRKCWEQGEDCHKCINACHLTHNVPSFLNPKDEVKWIWKETVEHGFHDQELEFIDEHLKEAPALMLCNHCDNPPCVKACPTQATWKRTEDGIVMMDWHRCIGCRYCIAACPYGSRSFNWRDPRPGLSQTSPEFPTRTRGVVEKCTFCEERLAQGLLPVCLQACPSGAMFFGDLDNPDSAVRAKLHNRFALRRKPGLGTKPQVYYLI